MAERVPVLLKGGPCDGRKTTAVRGGDLLEAVKCGGVWYDPTSTVTSAGRVVYTTRASQKPPPPPSAADVAKPIKAHRAWHGMLRSIFVAAPKELAAAEHARKALRELRHRRGLR